MTAAGPNKRRRQTRDALQSRRRKPDKHDIRLTRKQELYLDEFVAQVDRSQLLADTETAKKLRISRQTVSGWYRDASFRSRVSKILREENNDIWDHLVDRAVARRAIMGRPKDVEANLRRRGLWNDGPFQDVLPGDAAGAAAVANVTFIGLPEPPSPQEVRARNPPQGANWVIPAPALPPKPRAK